MRNQLNCLKLTVLILLLAVDPALAQLTKSSPDLMSAASPASGVAGPAVGITNGASTNGASTNGAGTNGASTINANKAMNVIVQYYNQPTQAQHSLAASFGGQLQKTLPLVKAAVYSMTPSQAVLFSSNSSVAYVSPDRSLGRMLDISRTAVLADIAQSYGWNGSGIGIAIIDSGIAPLADFGSRIVYSTSFNGLSPTDDFGHGTHVAGIAASNGQNSNGKYKGIAPNANIINLRVLDSNGVGTDSGVIAAINQAIALKSTYNIRVINISLGRPVQESYTLDPLCQAVEQAWQAGIVVVTSAGNSGRDNTHGTSGYGTITAPGNDPFAITVGAMKTMGTSSRSDDLIASYSSKGPTLFDHLAKPDLVAPGNLVVSDAVPGATIETQYPSNFVGSSYYTMSGTSMAAPMVAGAVALLLQQNPNMTPDQVKARLMKTAYKSFPTSSVATDPTTGLTYVSYYDIFTVGAGYLDVYAALNDSRLSSGYATSPMAVYRSLGNYFTLGGALSGLQSIWDNNSLWDTQSIWDTQSVWGSSILVSGTQSLWGSQSPWGNTSNPLWGTQSIWDTAIPYGESMVGLKGEK